MIQSSFPRKEKKMTDLVKIEIKDHIADVRLNRPDKYNALSPQMFQAIIEAGETVSQNRSVRVIILSGEGRGFCAGLDFESFMAMGSGKMKEDPERGKIFLKRSKDGLANYAQLAGYIWKKQEVPVIAALHGVAFGGGLQIALGADIRLAAPDARFSIMEIKWGIIPDMSITQTLPDLVPMDVAKELMFTGRIIAAPEARQLGLITRVCDDPISEARGLAKEIAGKSPDAIAAGKQLLESAWHSSAGEGLKLEEALQKSLISSPNQVEAVKANFENLEPDFKDRK
jgi:enoyl-CoA hydratase/carnithine racemase